MEKPKQLLKIIALNFQETAADVKPSHHIVLLFCSFASLVNSQYHSPIKFESITPVDFNPSINVDSSAAAIILAGMGWTKMVDDAFVYDHVFLTLGCQLILSLIKRSESIIQFHQR